MKQPSANPPRLCDTNDATGKLLRRVLSEPPAATFNVDSRFERLQQRLTTRPRPLPFIYAYGLAGVAAVLAVVAWMSYGRLAVTDHEKSLLATSASARVPMESELARGEVQLGDRASRRLDDGTTISVPAEGHAIITRVSQNRTVVKLSRGAVELNVSPRKVGDELEVAAGRFRFRVVGTRFRVAHDKKGVGLSVSEGRVEVLENGQVLKVVDAGGTWTEFEPEQGTQLEQDAAPEVRTVSNLGTSHAEQDAEIAARSSAPVKVDCLALARGGEHAAALTCFKRQSRGGGVSAEIGLYESARIEHEILGDPRRALETLKQHRERFAGGTLSVEVRLKVIQILTELGKDGEALEQSEALLSSGQLTAPETELRWLRGKLYKRQGRFDRAA
ncbi:MAG: FecR family protein, partial [Myxococcales bacterium]